MPHQDYIVDGTKYPSVTEILSFRPKPWLQKWKDKWGILADRKVLCATTVGTRFHEGAEALSRGFRVAYPSDRRLAKMLERYEEWLNTSFFVPLETELHVVSRTYKFHGTFDAIGTIGKGTFLIDYKTSSGIYPEMAEQLAAYAQAYYEETGKRITRGLIVHVSKDKPMHTLTVKEYSLTKTLFNKFLKRLKEYRKVNP